MKFDLSMFKVLIRKLFPPKKCVFTVDTTADGRSDSIQIKVLNLIMPFVIPKKFEYGNINLKEIDNEEFDLSQYGKIFLDDQPLNISNESVNLERIQNRILIYYKGESFNFNEIKEGKLSGKTIALGDSISILLKLDEGSLEMLTEGKHVFKIESDMISKLEIEFELNKNNMNISFDADKA